MFRERRQGRIEGAVKACDASSRYAEEPVGPSFVKIGDAAFTLDPLSSQGVQSAIASALQASIVVNTFAKYPANLVRQWRFIGIAKEKEWKSMYERPRRNIANEQLFAISLFGFSGR